ncbi:MAG: EAL domain-containing protein [Kangiellaceae bacterium]|nr:EAL domain-containing protein [Kangiellaceae bacterium]
MIATIDFDNYYQLIRKLSSSIKAVGVLDIYGELVDQDGNSDEVIMKKEISQITSSEEISTGVILSKTKSGHAVYHVNLVDQFDTIHGRLIVFLDSPKNEAIDNETSPADEIDACLRVIVQLMIHDLELNSELNNISEELTERYEELNLVYDASRQSPRQNNNSQESLEVLVNSCTKYLNVSMSALILPGRNVTIYDVVENIADTSISLIVPVLENELLSLLMNQTQSIVINNVADANKQQPPLKLPYKIIATPVLVDSTNVIGLLVIIKPLNKPDFTNSDRKLMEVMSRKVTKVVHEHFDDLTGLGNSRSVELMLDEALAQSRLRSAEHSVMFLDIDQLMIVNDISGHAAGDELIKFVASFVRNLLRKRDKIARLEGDKFIILLENCPLQAAAAQANKILSAVKSQVFRWKEGSHDLSVCIGIAPLTSHCDSVASILNSVETACRAAKKIGVSQIKVFEQNDVVLMSKRDEMRWVSRLQDALHENQFLIYAQTIVPLQNSKHSHFEILLRLKNSDGKIVQPGAFMPAAEQYKIMPLIDRWVIENTLDLLVDYPCRVAINLSGQSLSYQGFKAFVIEQLERQVVPNNHITFEITESAAIEHIDEATDFINSIKKLGCFFSLDDFGTGLSSFGYLKTMDVDFLKIDGSFVKEIENDPVSKVMVNAIHQVGKAMHIETIAEYVENSEIKDILTEMGIDYGQGYGISEPKPLQDYFEIKQPQENKHACRSIRQKKPSNGS